MVYHLKKIFDTNLISSVSATSNLNAAFDAVYKNRKNYHHNSDIWHLSKNWDKIRVQIQGELLLGQYYLEPVDIESVKIYELMLLLVNERFCFLDLSTQIPIYYWH